MKKSYIIKASIEASCGKKGCDINLYVLPFSGTKELFTKYAEELVKENKEINKTNK